MRGVPTIAGRLLAGGGRRAVLDLGLSAAGVAVSVAITLLVLGGIAGLGAREDRTAWRDPVVEPPGTTTTPVALQQRVAERVRGVTVEVVRVRPLVDGLPLPEGIGALPEPGGVLVSPALQRLLDGPDGDALLPRLGDRVAGALGEEALAHSRDAVALAVTDDLTATPAAELPTYDHRSAGELAPSPVVEVASLGGAEPDSRHALYLQLFGFAGVLLVAPSVLLLGAAARFTAARRARRLAGLRLAGASPGQISGIATVESTAGAVAGVALGIGLAQLGRVALSGVPLDGGPFGVADLGIPAWWTALVAVVAVLVAVTATLTGLRAVRASPLGVVRPAGTRRPSPLRVVGLAGAVVVFGIAAAAVGAGGAAVVLMVGLALLIGGVGLIGPWFTWLMGRITAGISRRPTPLLAGRAMTADPIGAFRPATPLVLSAFVGGCLLVVTGTTALLSTAERGEPVLHLPSATDVSAVSAALDDAGLAAEVSDAGDVIVEVPAGEDLEAVRTAIDGVVDPVVPVTSVDRDAEDARILADIGRGTWLLLALALVQCAAATGVGAAASTLEQGQTLAALRLAGMEPGRMLGVRAWHAAVPVGVVAALSTGLGAGAAWTIVLVSGPEGLPIGLGSLLGPPGVVLAAVAAAALGVVAAWPVLREVTARPLVDA